MKCGWWRNMGMSLLLLCSLTGGCATPPADTGSSAASKSPAPAKKSGFDWSRLNPFAWDYAQAGRGFQEKYHFKVGDTWIIKPPLEPRPVRLLFARSQEGQPVLPLPVSELADPMLPAPVPAAPLADAAAPAESTPPADATVPAAPAEPTSNATSSPVPPVLQVQVMELDLVTGNASLRDVDGRVYPFQTDPQRLERLRTLTRGPEWVMGDVKPQRDAEAVTYYTLLAIEADEVTRYQVELAVPGRNRKPLPALYAELLEMFVRAHRVAHPLSETINLLQ